jgi:hypothetical protein
MELSPCGRLPQTDVLGVPERGDQSTVVGQSKAVGFAGEFEAFRPGCNIPEADALDAGGEQGPTVGQESE